MAIKTVLFDMGNVLVHFCHARMCRQIGELCGQSEQEIRAALFDSELQWRFERGQMTEEEFHEHLQQRFDRQFPIADLQRAAADIFELNESIVPVLDALKQQHRLVLLSNTCKTHFDWVWHQYDVLQRFDERVLSFEVGAIKPEPAIYFRALEAIQCAPMECLYVDDIANYVAAGRSHGLHAEVFTETAAFLRQLQTHAVRIDPA